MRPRSLRAIMAIYVALILLALIGVRVADYFVTHKTLNFEVDRRLAAASVDISDAPDPGVMARRIAAAENDHNTADLYYLLVDRSGRRIAGRLRLRTLPPLGFTDFDTAAKVDGVAHGRALTRPVVGGATLVLVSDNDAVDAFNGLALRVQLAGLLGAIGIIVLGAIGIMRAIGARMRAMQRTVDAVIAGNMQSRIPFDGSRSEFDLQAQAFNRMLDRIDALMDNVRHAAKDVAHELKSPLARLRARTAALARRTEGAPVGAEVAELLDQIDDILDLFSSLLRLWEIEGGNRRGHFVDIDLGALAGEVGEDLQIVSDDAQRPLSIGPIAPAPVRGDAHLLRQMIVNLVENAIRHTPAGTHISIAAANRGGMATITVGDNGPGIPASDHATVFERFGRLEASNHVSGQGLGLTLVDAIARLHDGTLTLGDAEPGLRATVTLPLRR